METISETNKMFTKIPNYALYTYGSYDKSILEQMNYDCKVVQILDCLYYNMTMRGVSNISIEYIALFCGYKPDSHKGKINVDNDRFDDSGASSTAQSSAVPSASTSAAPSDVDNDSPANIKNKKKKKKLTRNEQKAREVRRRLRYLEWLNTPKGTPRPVDTDDEDE